MNDNQKSALWAVPWIVLIPIGLVVWSTNDLLVGLLAGGVQGAIICGVMLRG